MIALHDFGLGEGPSLLKGSPVEAVRCVDRSGWFVRIQGDDGVALTVERMAAWMLEAESKLVTFVGAEPFTDVKAGRGRGASCIPYLG